MVALHTFQVFEWQEIKAHDVHYGIVKLDIHLLP